MAALPDSPTHTPRISLKRDPTNGEVSLVDSHAKWRDGSYQAYMLLRATFVALPFAMGIDKYFNDMTYWPHYLAGWINDIAPGTAQQFMYVVGGIEILAAVLVALKPRYAAYVVGAWLLGITVNLFSSGNGFWDIGARDLALMGAAFSLAALARKWDPPLALERRLHHGS
jgi:hypothetical protein